MLHGCRALCRPGQGFCKTTMVSQGFVPELQGLRLDLARAFTYGSVLTLHIPRCLLKSGLTKGLREVAEGWQVYVPQGSRGLQLGGAFGLVDVVETLA